jgi:hypothetical protein
VDRWIGGSVDRWIGGSVDRWIGGSVDRWIGGSVKNSEERYKKLCLFLLKEVEKLTGECYDWLMQVRTILQQLASFGQFKILKVETRRYGAANERVAIAAF